MATYSYFEPDRAGTISTRKDPALSEQDLSVEILRVDDRFVLRVQAENGEKQTLWFTSDQMDAFHSGVTRAAYEVRQGME